MARRKKPGNEKVEATREQVPAGATRKALDNDRPYDDPGDTMRGDEDAAGTPMGGTEVGGLGGTNIGAGDPDNANLERSMGSDVDRDNEETSPPYAGPSGGAVGGTPAQGRSSGGKVHRGIAPGGVHRGDSTIGTDPNSGTD